MSTHKEIIKKILKDERFFSTPIENKYMTRDALDGTMSTYETVIEDSGRVESGTPGETIQTIKITRILSSIE